MKFLLGFAALSAALVGCGADESREGKASAGALAVASAAPGLARGDDKASGLSGESTADGAPRVLVAECAAKQDLMERQSCFDNLAATLKLLQPITSKTQPGVGSWHTSAANDPMTDQPAFVASLEARNGQGKYGGPVTLAIRCSKNKVDLYIVWSSSLGGDTVPVTYRPGKDASSTSSWIVSANKTSAFFPGSPVKLIRRIMQTDLFVVNVTPYGGNPVTAVFDTAGMDIALSDVRYGCRW